jgi:phosphoglucomutase
MSSTKETAMKINPLAGKPAEPSLLVNVPKLVTAYYACPRVYDAATII